MIKLSNGFFVIKLLQAKAAFVYAKSNLTEAIDKSDCKVILSEYDFGGGIQTDHLVASSSGEYGLDNLSVKVRSCGNYNINLLKISSGISIGELSSALLCSEGNKEELLRLSNDSSDSLDDTLSITIVNSLSDPDFNEDKLVEGVLVLVKNTESQKFVLLAPSGSTNSLIDKFTKVGIEALAQPAEELKFKKAADIASLKEITIVF